MGSGSSKAAPQNGHVEEAKPAAAPKPAYANFEAELNATAGAVKEFMDLPDDIKPRACLEVDVGALVHNVREIQRVAKMTASSVMGIVKADAYGHGAIGVV